MLRIPPRRVVGIGEGDAHLPLKFTLPAPALLGQGHGLDRPQGAKTVACVMALAGFVPRARRVRDRAQ